MKRLLTQNLLHWKNDPYKKPLILQGARQVGKSYLLEDFARKNYPQYVIFNFETDASLKLIFEQDLDPNRILKELSIKIEKKINPMSDLVIFDEIQDCPKALTSLKYFCEKMSGLHLIASGSLLGIYLNQESFPVGKVEFLKLCPMTFQEFLMAMGDDMLLEYFSLTKIIESDVAHQKLWYRLKEYYQVGGMPEAVAAYQRLCESPLDAFASVRKIQRSMIRGYMGDFAKHSGKINAQHIVSVFENIPQQLGGAIDDSVKRFSFKDVISGKKGYPDLQGPIDWLVGAGLVLKVKICNRSEIPLESFCKENTFKLYLFDVGILGAMLDLPQDSLLLQNYGIAKGYFAENFVLQEMSSHQDVKIYSWAHGESEIEFMKIIGTEIIPIEVKSGVRTQAKSLNFYLAQYHPSYAVKVSAKNMTTSHSKTSVIKNVPLYLAGAL